MSIQSFYSYKILIDEFQKLLDEDKITLKKAAKIAHWSDATDKI